MPQLSPVMVFRYLLKVYWSYLLEENLQNEINLVAGGDASWGCTTSYSLKWRSPYQYHWRYSFGEPKWQIEVAHSGFSHWLSMRAIASAWQCYCFRILPMLRIIWNASAGFSSTAWRTTKRCANMVASWPSWSSIEWDLSLACTRQRKSLLLKFKQTGGSHLDKNLMFTYLDV